MRRQRYALGNIRLESGAVLRDATLVYATQGRLNEARTNAVLLLTSFGSTDTDLQWMIGEDGIDPSRWYIIAINMLGNGVSTSPSNANDEQKAAAFPLTTIADNVDQQCRLVSSVLKIERVALVAGFSLGGMQAFEWAVRYPSKVRSFAVICGTYRASIHARLFIESILSSLEPDLKDPRRSCGRVSAARIFAAWGMSQAFYRREGFRELGFASAEEYVGSYWIPRLKAMDPYDVAAMLRTWYQAGRALRHPEVPAEQVIKKASAHGLLMPSATDLYFTVEDNLFEHRVLATSELRPIPSDWGHAAGSGRDDGGARFVKWNLRKLLEDL